MTRPFDPRPITLDGAHVRLEPLAMRHAEDLFAAAQDDRIWLYMPVPRPRTVADVERTIAAAHDDLAAGDQVPFAIVQPESGRAVGATRYLDIQRADRNLEIGWTWLGAAVQRTAVNTECKYLLLRHAFDTLGAVRVQLKTDGRNEQSQRAIRRIGARYEGTLRRQRRVWDGHVRDTVYFSILDSEWPGVKRELEAKLAAPHQAPATAPSTDKGRHAGDACVAPTEYRCGSTQRSVPTGE